MSVSSLAVAALARLGDVARWKNSTSVLDTSSLHGLAEQALKIGWGARVWIGLVANIGLGNVDQAGHMFFFHAMGRQAAANADA